MEPHAGAGAQEGGAVKEPVSKGECSLCLLVLGVALVLIFHDINTRLKVLEAQHAPAPLGASR